MIFDANNRLSAKDSLDRANILCEWVKRQPNSIRRGRPGVRGRDEGQQRLPPPPIAGGAGMHIAPPRGAAAQAAPANAPVARAAVQPPAQLPGLQNPAPTADLSRPGIAMVAIRGQTVTMRRADNRFDAREILVASGVPDSEKARLAGLLRKEGVRFGDGPVCVSLRHAELLTNATKLKTEMAPLLAVAQGLNLPEDGPINPDRDRPLPSVEGPPARAAPSITLGPPLEGIFQTILYRRNAIAYIPSQRFVNLRQLGIAYGLHHESALRWIKRHKVECQQITAVRTGFRGTYVHYAAAQAYLSAKHINLQWPNVTRPSVKLPNVKRPDVKRTDVKQVNAKPPRPEQLQPRVLPRTISFHGFTPGAAVCTSRHARCEREQ
ncbi:uncharacterized protein C8A04DRAFT_33159 [Dichotomopilus funicola]|uniref:Uncharacterized protein n=1 Tax=Dichotomopilus funicola TaxID=1934379 RepID=A0AAN6UUV9_9PEZI|nr:hypothetical protein C8A04DRAFT_33159 [Dichotomopilus funicola]